MRSHRTDQADRPLQSTRFARGNLQDSFAMYRLPNPDPFGAAFSMRDVQLL